MPQHGQKNDTTTHAKNLTRLLGMNDICRESLNCHRATGWRMLRAGIAAFRFLLRKRLLSDKPLPTVGECEGMVILALDFLTRTPGRPESPYGRGFF